MSIHISKSYALRSNDSNQIRSFILLTILLGLIFQLLNCAGAALPQTSLPLPENDPVSISGPNGNGIVTLTSSANSDLAGATLLVRVNANTANLDAHFIEMNLLSHLIRTANAQSTCSSSLPVCPTLSDGECQATANADGSFSVNVPATLSDTISASYLDPNTCAEIVLIEGKAIPNDVVTLDFETINISLLPGNSRLLLLGESNTGISLSEFDIDLMNLVGTFELNDFTPNTSAGELNGEVNSEILADGNQHVVISDNDEMYIYRFPDGLQNPGVSVADDSATLLENLRYGFSHSTAISDSNIVNFSCNPYTNNSQPVRLFFIHGPSKNIYIVDDTANPTGQLTARPLNFDLNSQSQVTGTLQQIQHIALSQSVPGQALVVFLTNDGNGTLSSWVATVDIKDGFCDDRLPILDIQELGLTATESNSDHFSVFDFIVRDASDKPSRWFALFDGDDQMLLLNDNLSIMTAPQSISDLISIDINELALSGSELKGVIGFQASSGSDLIKLVAVWDNHGPNAIMVYDPDQDLYSLDENLTENIVNLINPNGVTTVFDYKEVQNQSPDTYILDTGLEDDSKSFIHMLNMDDYL